jgi:heme a synthase
MAPDPGSFRWVVSAHYTGAAAVETSVRLQRYTVATVVATLVLIALGGAVRATDSGLACPTWPGCFHAGDFIPPADLHVWLEHTHRLVAGVVGLLIAGLTVWTWRLRRDRPALVRASTAALVLVVIQALLGAIVVLRLLQAELVTAHLGTAMVLLALLLHIAVTLARPASDKTTSGRLVPLGVVVAALCLAQILVGGHLTGVGGGRAFGDFPLMAGSVVPALTNEREVFHAGHRYLGLLFVLALLWLYVRVRAVRPDDPWLSRLAAAALVLGLVQTGVGAVNVWTGNSFVAVIPHLALASWLWAVLVLFVLLARRPPAAVRR